jgi:predicted esterase
LAAQPPAKVPLLVLLDGDAKLWQGWCSQRGWQFLAPWAGATEKSIDSRIKALEAQLADLRRRMPIDETRTYLAGQGDGATLVFYVAARDPDLWTAAVALGGSPRPAIDTGRLFAANSTNVPVLWLFGDPRLTPLAKQLQEAGYNLDWRHEPSAKSDQVFEWLAGHTRDLYPIKVDCETGTPAFARCYWVEVTKFDPAERNDVLPSTRLRAGSGAMLAGGPFGFDPAQPGPGVLVAQLPKDYEGPLKINDRIVAIAGKALPDADAYVQLMDQTTEEKSVVITVQRGQNRVRVETSIVLPKRDELVTARVQAQFLPEMKEIQVLSRAVAGLRVTVPADWAPAAIDWNGTEVAKAESGGCWMLTEEKELLSAAKCK